MTKKSIYIWLETYQSCSLYPTLTSVGAKPKQKISWNLSHGIGSLTLVLTIILMYATSWMLVPLVPMKMQWHVPCVNLTQSCTAVCLKGRLHGLHCVPQWS